MSSSLVQLGPDAAATAVLAGTVVFVIGAVGLSRSFFRRHLGQRLSGDALEIASVLGAKVASGLLFGFAGLLVLEATLPDAGALGWSLRWTGRALLVLAAAATICLAMVVRAARAPAMRERYPEARVSRWSVSAHALDAIGWIVYLYGYELLFRGALLFPLAHVLPLVAALAIHTAIYALAHLDKPLLEILGTLPMGFVFGWLALETQSILPGAALHVAIALTNSALCARSLVQRRGA
ncbi:MAG: CPBP family intramembrane glutamic endopeptidase [bacterium]